MRLRLVRTSRRPSWPAWAVIAVAVWTVAAGVVGYLSERTDLSAPTCLFKRLTGIPCPTCGLTRGGLCLLRGRPLEGWSFNPLAFTLLALAASGVALRVAFRRKLTLGLSAQERRGALMLLIALAAANWAYLIWCVG